MTAIISMTISEPSGQLLYTRIDLVEDVVAVAVRRPLVHRVTPVALVGWGLCPPPPHVQS